MRHALEEIKDILMNDMKILIISLIPIVLSQIITFDFLSIY